MDSDFVKALIGQGVPWADAHIIEDIGKNAADDAILTLMRVVETAPRRLQGQVATAAMSIVKHSCSGGIDLMIQLAEKGGEL